MNQKLHKFLNECPPRWRSRRIVSHPEFVEFLNQTYPNVSLSLQIDSFINNTSPYCAVCNMPVKTVGKTTCSIKCRSIMGESTQGDRIEKQKRTLLEKYGVDNMRNIAGAEERRKDTMVSKYGALVSPATRNGAIQRAESLNEKGRDTMLKKYGVENASQIEGYHKKRQDTLMKNYGVSNYFESDEFSKIKEQRREDKWNSFLPSSIEFLDIKEDSAKEQIFENPNLVITYQCSTCNTQDSAPTETVKWRIINTGTCCKFCANINNGSLKEKKLREFIESLGVPVSPNKRILDGKEIDIYIPSNGIGFEFDGLFWHNDMRVARNYHYEKTQIADTHGIRLIHVFEDEWDHRQEIVKSRIKNLLGKTDTRIPARKCDVREVDSVTEREFLNKNHIQGYAKSSVKIGLFFKDELVSLMTFSKPNLAKGQKKKDGRWELLRFCNIINTTVIGGANKLFSHFVDTHSPNEVLSFADSRWSKGDLYTKLGFESRGHTPPNYWYVNARELKRIHRFSMRKNSNDDQNLTEYENRLNQGFLRIWDCGSSKWIWRSTHPTAK